MKGGLSVFPGAMTPETWSTAQLTLGLGLLPDAIEPRIHMVINGDWSLTLKYPLNGRDADLLQLNQLIRAQGQLWRILSIEKEDGGSGRLLSIEAPHLAYDLRDLYIENLETSEDPFTLDGITAEQALTKLLEGTPFSPGNVNVPNTTLDYLDILQKNRMECLKVQLLPKWGGELVFDNWTIHLRAQAGLDRRYPIRRGRNLKAIKYIEDISGTITRLHVRGYNGANFEEINAGKDYIDSPNIGAYGRIKEGYVDFPDDDLVGDLMQKALDYLPTVDIPLASYDVDLAALKKTKQYALYAPLEEFGLGDSALIHHDFFQVDILARCLEIEQDAVSGANLRVVLGNHKKDLYGALSASARAAQRVEGILTPEGRVRGEKLQGTLDLLQVLLQASGSYANAQVVENQGILLQNTNPDSPDYGSLYLGPAVLALANERNGDNSWAWGAAITPQGIAGQKLIAHSVTANALAADVGQSLDLSSNVSITSRVSREEVVQMIGYRAEVIALQGVMLSDHITQTVLRARVWNGNADVTDQIAANRFVWIRESLDSTADQLWNVAHTGVKSITVTTSDVVFQATFTCNILEEE